MIELNNNPVQVSQWIERKAIDDSTTLLDVICEFCKDNDVEYSEIVPYLTDNLKRKIHVEAEKLRLYKTNIITL
jgi:uncharacterized protein YaaW (UPF0174 family)